MIYPASAKAPTDSPCPLRYYEKFPLNKVLLEFVRLYERWTLLLNPLAQSSNLPQLAMAWGSIAYCPSTFSFSVFGSGLSHSRRIGLPTLSCYQQSVALLQCDTVPARPLVILARGTNKKSEDLPGVLIIRRESRWMCGFGDFAYKPTLL